MTTLPPRFTRFQWLALLDLQAGKCRMTTMTRKALIRRTLALEVEGDLRLTPFGRALATSNSFEIAAFTAENHDAKHHYSKETK